MARFMRREITKVWFCPTIASLAAPTVAEVVTAGEDLTPDISEINGFTFSNSPIQTPDLASKFVSQIPGEDSTDESSIVFYQDDTDTTIYDALVKDDTGYICIFDLGVATPPTPAAGDECDVWPVTVSSKAKRYSAGNEAAMFEVKFAMTDPPTYNSTIAA